MGQLLHWINGDVAPIGRAPVLQSGGCRFKSVRFHYYSERLLMAEQKQKEKQSSGNAESPQETEAKDLQNSELQDDVDAILDEIDEVLEENAQEFVANYIQKGGQ